MSPSTRRDRHAQDSWQRRGNIRDTRWASRNMKGQPDPRMQVTHVAQVHEFTIPDSVLCMFRVQFAGILEEKTLDAAVRGARWSFNVGTQGDSRKKRVHSVTHQLHITSIPERQANSLFRIHTEQLPPPHFVRCCTSLPQSFGSHWLQQRLLQDAVCTTVCTHREGADVPWVAHTSGGCCDRDRPCGGRNRGNQRRGRALCDAVEADKSNDTCKGNQINARAWHDADATPSEPE